jgi:hypothetical protein
MLLFFRAARRLLGLSPAAVRRMVRVGVQQRAAVRVDVDGNAVGGVVVIVEGTTGKERRKLTDDGGTVVATGLSAPVLILRDRDGRDASVSGVTEWVTEATAVVDIALGSLALSAARSPYSARLKLTDAAGRVHYYPNTEKGDEWKVVTA